VTDGSSTVAGSVWDEVLDTGHVRVLRTYIERWARRKGPAEKVLVIVVEPGAGARSAARSWSPT
jgi:hypothetical protein